MENRQTLQVPVTAMTCASCVRRVEQALLKVPGVDSAAVNLATERADLVLSDKVKASDLVQALDKAGYQLALSKSSFQSQA